MDSTLINCFPFVRIKYFSLKEAEKLVPNEDTIMISIRDPGGRVHLKQGWKNLIEIECDDLDPDELRSIGRMDLIRTAKFFNEDDARKIVKASVTDRPIEIRNIYVHCKAGTSRSAAVAQALAEHYRVIINKSSNPNPLILNVLRSILNK